VVCLPLRAGVFWGVGLGSGGVFPGGGDLIGLVWNGLCGPPIDAGDFEVLAAWPVE